MLNLLHEQHPHLVSSEPLNSASRDELICLMKRYGLFAPKRATKSQLIKNYLEPAKEVSSQTLANIRTAVLRASSKTDAAHHDHYLSMFNAIDVHDRFWYDIPEYHFFRHWEAKYIFSILNSGLINLWVLKRHSVANVELLNFVTTQIIQE